MSSDSDNQSARAAVEDPKEPARLAARPVLEVEMLVNADQRRPGGGADQEG